MNDFERLLHELLDGTNNFWDARYIGRACYAPITEDLRIKAEFQSTLAASQYNALKLTAISNKNGVIDTLTLHFSDYFPDYIAEKRPELMPLYDRIYNKHDRGYFESLEKKAEDMAKNS